MIGKSARRGYELTIYADALIRRITNLGDINLDREFIYRMRRRVNRGFNYKISDEFTKKN